MYRGKRRKRENAIRRDESEPNQPLAGWRGAVEEEGGRKAGDKKHFPWLPWRRYTYQQSAREVQCGGKSGR